MKKRALLLAAVVPLAFGGSALAKHATHTVTPKNIDDQPFGFIVHVNDVGQLKEFEIIVQQKPNHLPPVASATGVVGIAPSDKKKTESPAVTRVLGDGMQTYTFRVPSSDLGRAHFTFTETLEDPRIPFPFPGDYWVFNLNAFAAGPNK